MGLIEVRRDGAAVQLAGESPIASFQRLQKHKQKWCAYPSRSAMVTMKPSEVTIIPQRITLQERKVPRQALTAVKRSFNSFPFLSDSYVFSGDVIYKLLVLELSK